MLTPQPARHPNQTTKSLTPTTLNTLDTFATLQTTLLHTMT